MNTARIPDLSATETAAVAALTQHIAADIAAHGGAIPFSRFMQSALYTPQLGYYTGGAHKLGAAGDFVTAPLLSPLFGQTLAVQLAEILPQTDGNVYEFGAGTGELAACLINTLSGSLKRYYIIELSAELSQRQRQHIAEYAPDQIERVEWLPALPPQLDGIVIGNEVLDAMPVERIRSDAAGQWQREYTAWHNGAFVREYRPLCEPDLLQAAAEYCPMQPEYATELHPAQYAFVRTLGEKLTRGAMIWIDYGFDAAQYYHPQRTDGTLIGHHRHHSIHDPFYRVGLTDLTAHVNFSDIAAAGCNSGLDLIGYTTQAAFLLNLGILDALAAAYPHTDSADYIRAAHAVQILTAPQEMGELFKVIAFGRQVAVDWRGFAVGDLCHKL